MVGQPGVDSDLEALLAARVIDANGGVLCCIAKIGCSTATAFINGLLQCTLGFVRLSRTDAMHSLRNDLVRKHSQSAGKASRSRDLRYLHRYHDCSPPFDTGMLGVPTVTWVTLVCRRCSE
jgi:hypothetical protein